MRKILISCAFIFANFISPILLYAEINSAEKLNQLLRGELSACETYKQAMEKVSGLDLSKNLEEHKAAVIELEQQVVKAGGIPSKSSGVWGTWAQVVTGAAKAIGQETALKALKEGEEHGIKEYQEVLNDEDVSQTAKNVIQQKLLPKQFEHIKNLNKLIDKV